MADHQRVILEKDDYREFTFRVAKLTEQGYELAYEVERISEDDTYRVTLYGEHDFEELDRLTD
jgi:predicted xylose isomerase-like sugar epimerase|tara:strand:+ start:490 stop:678 length:189 start_codon:yes stop_codon:yes gene_type:complete